MELRRQIRNTIIGLLVVIGVGTAGYMIIEGWNLLDSFYMTIITVTTIGFGEINPLSSYGRVFTLFIIFTGIGLMGSVIVTGTGFIVAGEIKNLLTRRKSMKALQELKDHYIICGFGRVGSFVADQLDELKVPFVVVEENPKYKEKLDLAGYLCVHGDATEEETLVNAGIAKAKVLITTLDMDAANVSVVLSAKDLNPEVEIIARAAAASYKKKLEKAGADRVVSQYEVTGLRILASTINPVTSHFLDLALDCKQSHFDFAEIKIQAGSELCGIELCDSGIQNALNLIVVSIKKTGDNLIFNPAPHTKLEMDDTLVVLGNRQDLRNIAAKAGTSSLNT